MADDKLKQPGKTEKTASSGDGPDMSAIAQAVGDGDGTRDVDANKNARTASASKGGSSRKTNARPLAPETANPAPSAKQATAEVPEVAPAVETISHPVETPEVTAMANETMNTMNDTVNTMNDTASQQADKMNNMAGDMQGRLQAFYERSNVLASDMNDLGRGNVEAMVESSRILAAGLQDIGRSTLDETRTVYEGLTDDVKRMAAVKSPTELMQLQSEMTRRNLDALITQTSKNAESMLKLANDMFAPVSSRMSVTMEKLSNAA